MGNDKQSVLVVSFSPAIDSAITLNEPLRNGNIHRVVREVTTFGGKAINVAKILKMNNLLVSVAGIIGEDSYSDFLGYLEELDITAKFLKVPYPTRKNIMIKDAAGRGFKINYPAFPLLKMSFKEIEVFIKKLAMNFGMIILSGSLPSGLGTNTYARLVKIFKRNNQIAVVDTSGEPLKLAIESLPNIIKPNREEFAEICASSLHNHKAFIEAIRHFSSFIEVVIVSVGRRGAFFGYQGTVWHVIPPYIEAKDSTGSGDYLLGQFCADFIQNGRIISEDIMARAVAAGAACAEVEATPLIRKNRILKLSHEVIIKRIC